MTTPRRLEFREVKRAEIDRIWTIDRREHIANDYRLVDGALHFDPVATVLNIEMVFDGKNIRVPTVAEIRTVATLSPQSSPTVAAP